MNIYVLIIVSLLGVITFFVGERFIGKDADVPEGGGVIYNSPDKNTFRPSTPEPEIEVQNLGTVIDLSNKDLTKAPEYIFNESGVEVLNLSNNKLSGALQAEIRHMVNLRVLDLSNNNFTGVPAEIGQLNNLEVLDLSGNPITGLPYELANLTKLKSLDLRETNYSSQDLEVIKKGLPADVVIYLQ